MFMFHMCRPLFCPKFLFISYYWMCCAILERCGFPRPGSFENIFQHELQILVRKSRKIVKILVKQLNESPPQKSTTQAEKIIAPSFPPSSRAGRSVEACLLSADPSLSSSPLNLSRFLPRLLLPLYCIIQPVTLSNLRQGR